MTIPFLEPPGWVRVTDTDGRQRGFDPRYLVSCKEHTIHRAIRSDVDCNDVDCNCKEHTCTAYRAGQFPATSREYLLTLAREGHTEFITIDETQLAVVQRVFDDGL